MVLVLSCGLLQVIHDDWYLSHLTCFMFYLCLPSQYHVPDLTQLFGMDYLPILSIFFGPMTFMTNVAISQMYLY